MASSAQRTTVFTVVFLVAATVLWLSFMQGSTEPPPKEENNDPPVLASVPSPEPTPHPPPPSPKPPLPAGRPLPPSAYRPKLPGGMNWGYGPACSGIARRPVGPPKPIPPNPRYLLIADAWERQQTGTIGVEAVGEIVSRFGLVLVEPFVRMSNIQGIPGWLQYRSTQALDGFTVAEDMLPMSAYYDVAYTRQFIPMVTFEEFLKISKSTITTYLMIDWDNDGCKNNRPEWYPAYNTEIQATQLVCVQSRFSVDDLNQQLLDLWYRPGAGQPIPEAQGRADTGVPSLILSNWRKHAFAPRRGMNNLVTGCRFRWNSAWAALSKEWAEQHLPQNYVTIHIRSGNPLRTYWIPKNKNGIVHCFQQIIAATRYYLSQLDLPQDAPVFLATEWPDPPEGRWHYNTTAWLTEAFNTLYKSVNTVVYKNSSFDIGIVTLIDFYILLNSAVVIAIEDTMMQLVHQYKPELPLAIMAPMGPMQCRPFTPPYGP